MITNRGWGLWVVTVLWWAAPLGADDAGPSQPGEAAKAGSVESRGEDEAAIRATARSFEAAMSARDAARVAAHFLDDADYVAADGSVVVGREAIEAAFAALFAARPQSHVAIRIDNVRFLGPQTALEDGRLEISPPPAGPPAELRYTAVHAKQADRWQLAAIREMRIELPSHYPHLRQLEWLVGEWVNEDDSASVRTQCQWSENKNFLLLEFAVQARGRELVRGTQRIGWDPRHGTIRSWVFDTRGGTGQALWTRQGDRWQVRIDGVDADGAAVAATRILQRQGPDSFRLETLEQTVDGEPVAVELPLVVVVRSPPPPESAESE